jgi:cation diffusion facilitator family transporter
MEATMTPQDALRIEQAALRLGFWMSILFAAAPFAVAMLTDSQLILLEAKYGIADAFLAWLTLVAFRKIQQPPDRDYHFGYAKYEPMVNALEGIMVILVCLTTLLAALQDIVHPDDVDLRGLIVLYAGLSAAACLALYAFMRAQARRCASELLEADATVWLIDGALSLGTCGAFAACDALSRTRWAWVTPFVDPVLAILLALGLLPSAYSLLKESGRDLLDASPGGEVQRKVESLVEVFRERHGLQAAEGIRLRKAGRRLFISMTFPDTSDKSASELGAIKRGLRDDLRKIFPEVDLHLFFDRTTQAPEKPQTV